jgi:hypothetical protein
VTTTCGVDGMATLEGSGTSTLGQPGAGRLVGPVLGGPRRRHNSKRSCRLAKASIWEIHVGGGGIHEGTCHDLEAMDYLVFCRGRQDSAVGVSELHCVGDDLALGVTLD